MAFAFIPPAALELGNATGFSFVITDDNNLGHLKLAAARDKLLAAATKDPRWAGVRIFGHKDVGQLQIDVDKALAGAHGLTQADVNATIRDRKSVVQGKSVGVSVDHVGRITHKKKTKQI